MRRFLHGLAFLALLFFASFGPMLMAAEPEPGSGTNIPYAPPQAPPQPSATSMLARLFGMTLFVLLICAGVLWGIRKMQRRGLTAAVNPAKLRLVEEIALNSHSAMQLVQAGTARVLFAVDSTGLKSCQLVDSEFAGVLAAIEQNRVGREQGPTVADMMALLSTVRKAA